MTNVATTTFKTRVRRRNPRALPHCQKSSIPLYLNASILVGVVLNLVIFLVSSFAHTFIFVQRSNQIKELAELPTTKTKKKNLRGRSDAVKSGCPLTRGL